MENESKKMAWFPAPYLEKIEDDFDDEDDVDGIPEGGMCIVTGSNNTLGSQNILT